MQCTLQHLVRDPGLSLWAYGGVVAGAAFLMVQVCDFSLSQLDANKKVVLAGIADLPAVIAFCVKIIQVC